MKRKQQRKSAGSGRQLPSERLGDASSFSNKNSAPVLQNSDFQKLGYLFYNLLVAAKELDVKLIPYAFTDPSHSKEIIYQPDKIVNSIKDLNLEDKITPKTFDHIGFFNPEFISEFHSIFYNNGLTRTKPEDFIPRFIGGTMNGKIIWSRGDNLLTFTFEHLMIKGLIPYYDDPWKVLAEHFCNKNEKDYTSKQLRRSHSKKVRDFSKLDMIRKAFLPLIKKVDVK